MANKQGIELLLEDKEFLAQLQSIADSNGQTFDQIRNEAREYLKELYTEQKPLVNAITVQIIQYILGRAYDDLIDIRPDEIKKISKLMRRHPVAFVMTHKTYIDMMVLAAVLVKHGLELPYTFAGINMGFLGLGEIGRMCGVIFIRRSFKDNQTYKVTLRHFISNLVDHKAHFMWAIEGTRSRTGKLVWPKMGILKYIADADDDSKKDVKYVPVSVVYDLIPDVHEMTEEGRGKDKNPESLFWFLNYLKNLSGNFGKISLRIGDPLERSATQHASVPMETDLINQRTYTLPRFAFELVHRINQITPVTTSSLICTILLSKFASDKPSMERDVVELMELVERHKPDALVDRGKPIGECVQHALNLLIQSNLIQQLGQGIKAKYSIVTRNYLSATYYANMAVHHFYHRAFIEMALLKIDSVEDDRLNAFWTDIMEIRNMFKFEFFYSIKSDFSDEIEKDLAIIHKNWEKEISNPKSDLIALVRKQNILVSHVVLHTYIEAYKVVAQALDNLDLEEFHDEDSLLDACLFVGEEMHWQGQIHRVESVSKPFLINGIRLAKNKNLIPSKEDAKKKEIKAFASTLKDLDGRIKKMQGWVLESKPKRKRKALPLAKNVVPGTRSEHVTTDIMSSEEGSHIGAFFDLDRTLIKGFSAKEFFQTRLLSGKMSTRELAAQFSGVVVYAIGNKNFAGLASIGAKGVSGIEEKIFLELGEEVYMKHLADAIYPESRALVAAHLNKGHTVAIISAATPYQVNPIARDLGVDNIVCTEMEVIKGKFTGKILEPACWGEGKAIGARKLVDKYDLDLSKSFFYTDSFEDLPLLEIVGHPRPINPDNALAAYAFQHDWPIYRFNDAIQPGVSNIIRTGLTVGSFVPAAVSGFLSSIMTGSMREGVNSMMSTVGELGTKMAGIELVVKNEEYMWSHRPAVFIFNHQSSADFFIVAKLLKKDAVAIAKKELKSSPIGPLLSLAGVIFIDRSDRNKAIEAMAPAVDTLKGGTSVAIAPEGTRSYDYRLGPFKKGAFHLAMQAGVPIVPIVIKNAHDVMPRGTSLVRPSVVEVIIMEPLSVDDWTHDNMNEKINDLRNRYLMVLHQEVLDLVSG